jgi:hypothetical protein
VKLDPIFRHLYPPFRKEKVAEVEVKMKCSFHEFIRSPSYLPPEILKKTPESDAMSILSEVSEVLSDKVRYSVTRAKQALAQQLKLILRINPPKRQGVPASWYC